MMELICGKCGTELVYSIFGSLDKDSQFIEPCALCSTLSSPSSSQHPIIRRFAAAMEDKFRLCERHKSGWENLTNQQCFTRIDEEQRELIIAIKKHETPTNVMGEAVDIGLFLCFLAENYTRRFGKDK